MRHFASALFETEIYKSTVIWVAVERLPTWWGLEWKRSGISIQGKGCHRGTGTHAPSNSQVSRCQCLSSAKLLQFVTILWLWPPLNLSQCRKVCRQKSRFISVSTWSLNLDESKKLLCRELNFWMLPVCAFHYPKNRNLWKAVSTE